MTTHAYHDVLDQVQNLPLEDQQRLLEDLEAIIQRRVSAKPKHSILELRGLGKEIWEGIDVEQYLNEERNSWD